MWGANEDVCATRKTFGDGDDDDVQRATFENARNNVCLNYIREFRTQVYAGGRPAVPDLKVGGSTGWLELS